jgi:hypothetical protein
LNCYIIHVFEQGAEESNSGIPSMTLNHAFGTHDQTLVVTLEQMLLENMICDSCDMLELAG